MSSITLDVTLHGRDQFPGTVETQQNCHSDRCACNSHDREYQRVTFTPDEEIAIPGKGCVDSQCNCHSHPCGFVSRTLYRLGDMWWVWTDSYSTGLFPSLKPCDKAEVLARYEADKASYERDLEDW